MYYVMSGINSIISSNKNTHNNTSPKITTFSDVRKKTRCWLFKQKQKATQQQLFLISVTQQQQKMHK